MIDAKQIAEQFVPILRRTLATSDDPRLRELSESGKIWYLAENNINQNEVAILDGLIASLSADKRSPEGLEKLREAIVPYVGQKLLKAGVWFSGKCYQVYVDPASETVVHVSSGDMPEPGVLASESRAEKQSGS
jgi:hypothetical protein